MSFGKNWTDIYSARGNKNISGSVFGGSSDFLRLTFAKNRIIF